MHSMRKLLIGAPHDRDINSFNELKAALDDYSDLVKLEINGRHENFNWGSYGNNDQKCVSEREKWNRNQMKQKLN